jgi:hypothetical protein
MALGSPASIGTISGAFVLLLLCCAFGRYQYQKRKREKDRDAVHAVHDSSAPSMADLYKSPDENVRHTNNPLFEPASEVGSMSMTATAMEGSDVHNPMVIRTIGRLSTVGQLSSMPPMT